MKKWMALTMVVLMMALGFIGCKKADQTDLEYIKGKGKMVVGVTESAPMNFKDDKGEWTGFDTEFTKLVCKELGVEPEFVILTDWGQKFYELETKNVDVVWNGMTITEEAKLNANVTNAYVVNSQVVVMKADKVKNFPDVESMKDLKMAVESGSAGEALLNDNGFKTMVALQDQAAALMEVAAGTADACVVDITLANALVGKEGGYKDLAVGLTLSSEEYGIAFRKGSDVTAKVNEIIAKLKKDGTLQKLAEKYNLTLAD